MPKKKSVTKKSTSRKTPAKKAAKPKPAKKAARKRTAKKAGKPKASELLKRVSHTPAIFKPGNKRPAAILFRMDDIREVLKKRAAEEEKEKAAAAKSKAAAAAAAKSVEAAKKIEEVDPPRKSKHGAASLEDILGLSGGGSNSQNSRDSIPRKHKKYYDLLIALRKEVRDELNLHSNDTLKRSQKDDAGDIAISVDAGTDSFDRDFALSLLSSEQEALNEIESAIIRIHKGSYGICEVTGEPINKERLEAVPFTRFSVEGQKEYEQNARKRVSRAGAFLNEASGEKITFGDDDGDN